MIKRTKSPRPSTKHATHPYLLSHLVTRHTFNMTSDCYCAICGSCIGNFEVGSKSEKGQRVRSKVLRNRRRRGAEPQESISEPDDDSYNNRDEESHTLSGQYDPQVLEGHDTSWITELLLVANDPRKRRPPRTFICGTARDTGFGWGTCSGTQDAWKYGVEDYECDRLPLWLCGCMIDTHVVVFR